MSSPPIQREPAVDLTVAVDKAGGNIVDRARDALDRVADKALDMTDEVRATVGDRAQAIARRARDSYEDAALRAVDAAEDVQERLQQRPWTSLLIAGAAGLIVGLLLSNRTIVIRYDKD